MRRREDVERCSENFPLVNPIKNSLNGINGDDFDAFVAKLDPNGSKLLYSTFLGGGMDDGPRASAGGVPTQAGVLLFCRQNAGRVQVLLEL